MKKLHPNIKYFLKQAKYWSEKLNIPLIEIKKDNRMWYYMRALQYDDKYNILCYGVVFSCIL